MYLIAIWGCFELAAVFCGEKKRLNVVFEGAKESPRSYRNRGSGKKSEELICDSQREREFFLSERIEPSL